jgi:uncharacterized membrane-anchored protein
MRRVCFFPSAAILALSVTGVATSSLPFVAQAQAAPEAPAEPSAEAKALSAKIAALPWVEGPAKPAVTPRAAITLDPKLRYLDPAGTNTYLKLTGNLPEDNTYVVAAKNGNWSAFYSFDDIGYVKDDEKIDPDALIKSIREGQISGNEQRKEQGLDALTVVGWAVPPHYDPATHNLEYGITLGSPSGNNINYHLRMLGRKGVMDATLITSEHYLKEDLAEFREANKGFAYVPDENYAAFKEGDKVSEYGLAALVTGGVAAAALKGGLLKGLLAGLAAFWKLIAVGVVAFFGAFRSFFARLFGKGEDLGPPPQE